MTRLLLSGPGVLLRASMMLVARYAAFRMLEWLLVDTQHCDNPAQSAASPAAFVASWL